MPFVCGPAPICPHGSFKPAHGLEVPLSVSERLAAKFKGTRAQNCELGLNWFQEIRRVVKPAGLARNRTKTNA